MNLRNLIEFPTTVSSTVHAGGQGSGRHKTSSERIAKMTPTVWVSKNGKETPVWKMNDNHLANVLRQLHEQLHLVRGEKNKIGPAVIYKNRASGKDGKIIEKAIPPYRAMVREAEKRKLGW